jgi:hypothetical protein
VLSSELHWVSPFTVHCLLCLPPPTTRRRWTSFSPLLLFNVSYRYCLAVSGFAHSPAGSPQRLAVSSFLSCGRHLRFQLLSTPAFADAVTFGYHPVSEPDREGLSPPKTVHPHGRTGAGFQPAYYSLQARTSLKAATQGATRCLRHNWITFVTNLVLQAKIGLLSPLADNCEQ